MSIATSEKRYLLDYIQKKQTNSEYFAQKLLKIKV